MKRKQPTTNAKWLSEILLAIEDARGGESVNELVGDPMMDANLFHLAPIISMKFRGLDYRNEKLSRKVTEGALANYVANSDPEGVNHGLASRPFLAFAVCYVTAHYVLDLIDEQQAESLLNYCDKHLD